MAYLSSWPTYRLIPRVTVGIFRRIYLFGLASVNQDIASAGDLESSDMESSLDGAPDGAHEV
jgi:hypothetical protein